MSRTDEIRALETERAQRRAEERPQRTTPPVRAKPVRKTVDLPPQRYAALNAWCGESATQLGRARITGQDVLNALVARLLTDETLAHKILADLQADLN